MLFGCNAVCCLTAQETQNGSILIEMIVNYKLNIIKLKKHYQ